MIFYAITILIIKSTKYVQDILPQLAGGNKGRITEKKNQKRNRAVNDRDRMSKF